jgi:hypothetical protein
MQFNVRVFAVTLGLILGSVLFLETWWIILFGGEGASVTTSMVYHGYDITPIGSFYGLFWGFLDGCIFGGIFAWLYNRLLATRLGK